MIRHRFSALLIPLILGLPVASVRTVAGPGDLDLTFGGGDGIVTTAVGTSHDYGRSVVIQADGKILVGGSAGIGEGTDFALARYDSAGAIDPTFGDGGLVTTDFGGVVDFGRALTIQTDGRIVLAGYSVDQESNSNFALARYTSEGGLDPTFGTGGLVTTQFGTVDSYAQAIAIQEGGKIVAAGYATNPAYYDFALARYNPDGTLDWTFGQGGTVITTIGQSYSQVYDLAIDVDKIVAVGSADFTGFDYEYDFTLARYGSDGTLDPTFDGDGIAATDFGGDEAIHGVVLQPDSRILAVGNTIPAGGDIDFALARYNPDGSLDGTFGADGVVKSDLGTPNDDAWDVVLRVDGRLLVVGEHGSAPDFAVARYLPDGTLDSGFGDFGYVTTAVGSGNDYSVSVALQDDAKIVAAGFSSNGTDYDLALARYLGEGDSPPAITGFSPEAGVVGSRVTVIGNGFTDATDVRFNGVSAAFRFLSDQRIRTRVPFGAHTGPIEVTTPYGTATGSGDFKVKPRVTNFLPTSGSVGTLVTIRGSAFTDATRVLFNGVDALFSVVDYSTIKATVPEGASTGHIFVVTPGGVGVSRLVFTVTEPSGLGEAQSSGALTA
jgi:uncharacterized delta-60 repeat protein